MLLGPVFSFELLTASRRVRYFVIRGLYGSVLAAALFLVWMTVFYDQSFPPSQNNSAIAQSANFMAGFFMTFSVMQLLATVMLGPAIAAGTIASERERRTIEYLFTANLSNAEIVLSKLAARLLQIMVILLAGMPILAIAMLQGGIAPEALLAVYVVTFSTAITVASLSIAVSVWSATARDAVTRAYLVLLMLLVVPAVVAGLSLSFSLNSVWYDILVDYLMNPLITANPFCMLDSVVSGTSGVAMSTGWSAVGSLVRNQMIFSAVCVAYATLSVRRVHIRQMGRSKAKSRWLILPRLRPGLGDRPMLWKELFAASASSKLGMIGRIAICVLAACVLVPIMYQFHETLTNPSGSGWRVESYLMATTICGMLVSCGILLLIATRSACSITSEKERDCWQSLLSTPLSGFEIVRGKVLGSIYAVRYLFGVLFLMWGLAVIISPTYLFAVPFMLYTLLVIAVSVASLGVIFSLRMKSSLWAMAATLGTTIFVGGGYFFCCLPFFIVSNAGEEIVSIVCSPCIPFILFIPGMIAADGFPHNDGEIVAAYVLGTMGYSITACMLFASAFSIFDKFAGRTEPGFSLDGKYRDLIMEKHLGLAAELVEAQRWARADVVEAEILDEEDGESGRMNGRSRRRPVS